VIFNQVQKLISISVGLIQGICGGSASGKTTVAKKIIEDLGVPWVCLLSMDSFYKVLNSILLVGMARLMQFLSDIRVAALESRGI
jgi:pantothenate kinase-related protein Tda10